MPSILGRSRPNWISFGLIGMSIAALLMALPQLLIQTGLGDTALYNPSELSDPYCKNFTSGSTVMPAIPDSMGTCPHLTGERMDIILV